MFHDVIISAITKPSMGWRWLSNAKDKIFFAFIQSNHPCQEWSNFVIALTRY